MNLVEGDRALHKIRLYGIADVLETRLRQTQSDKTGPLDLVSALVSDELLCRQDRLVARRLKQARFRDPDRSLDSFYFDFNWKMNRALVYELGHRALRGPARGRSLPRPARNRKKAIWHRPSAAPPSSRAIRVVYREAHTLIEETADASLDGSRKQDLGDLAAVPLLIIDDLGMRKRRERGS